MIRASKRETSSVFLFYLFLFLRLTQMTIKQWCRTTCWTCEVKTWGPCLFLTTEHGHVQLPLTYNQYDDLQHMSGTWLPSLMPPFWRKTKSSSTIDFSFVLRLVNYINNTQQQHQQEKIRWSSSSVISAPFSLDILPGRIFFSSSSSCILLLLLLCFPLWQPSCNFVAIRVWQYGSFTAFPHCVSWQDGITAQRLAVIETQPGY